MFEKESEAVDFINNKVKNIFKKYQYDVSSHQLKKKQFDKKKIEKPIRTALARIKDKLIQALNNETKFKELPINSKQKENEIKYNNYSRKNQTKSIIEILVNLFVCSIKNFQW
ncbi:hypothetical protein EDI_221100 [Entamoeba dispar SAW760]|uniref:Uncharacterized protein n=1 Tax=Entamoeba dispar (strain ATCC PRA-260 / SAW760) TaxID=370354 RepID=B0EJN6_ENTDS|nr:uncharacterized protein EDI_221100 [Entamoeba dispar SAW760]EDR25261.1 hypothetical protein EDI_221100 [Entamoeba dispar SAW760]|eukprot:EDR25261.1 hypothetical protein EDI_221100 [Entamoeba dispar SAW760]